MFTCDMSESQQKTVPLNGVEASIAEKLIDFAYTSGTDRIKLYGLVIFTELRLLGR
jgi:hypothetical protein